MATWICGGDVVESGTMARGFHDADRGRRHGSRTIVIEASTARVDRVRDGCGVRGERGFHDSLTF
jgi:hypothetical protein